MIWFLDLDPKIRFSDGGTGHEMGFHPLETWNEISAPIQRLSIQWKLSLSELFSLSLNCLALTLKTNLFRHLLVSRLIFLLHPPSSSLNSTASQNPSYLSEIQEKRLEKIFMTSQYLELPSHLKGYLKTQLHLRHRGSLPIQASTAYIDPIFEKSQYIFPLFLILYTLLLFLATRIDFLMTFSHALPD